MSRMNRLAVLTLIAAITLAVGIGSYVYGGTFCNRCWNHSYCVADGSCIPVIIDETTRWFKESSRSQVDWCGGIQAGATCVEKDTSIGCASGTFYIDSDCTTYFATGNLTVKEVDKPKSHPCE